MRMIKLYKRGSIKPGNQQYLLFSWSFVNFTDALVNFVYCIYMVYEIDVWYKTQTRPMLRHAVRVDWLILWSDRSVNWIQALNFRSGYFNIFLVTDMLVKQTNHALNLKIRFLFSYLLKSMIFQQETLASLKFKLTFTFLFLARHPSS